MYPFGLASPLWSMTTREGLWSNQQHWPTDAIGRIFLPRAILRFGAFVAEGWTGTEPAVSHKEPLPERNVVGTPVEQHRYATQLLLAGHEGYQTRAGGPMGNAFSASWLGRDPMPNDDEWTWAHQASVKRAANTEPQLERFLLVCAVLKDLLESGQVRSLERDFHGDDFRPIAPGKWIGERLQFRFDLARFDSRRPFEPKAVEHGGAWTFVEGADIEAVGVAIERGRRAQAAAAETVSATKQDVEKFYTWLVGQMKASPADKPRPKDEFQGIAREEYGVGPRKFRECWDAAIKESGATAWARSGAPRGARKSKPKPGHVEKS